MKNFILPKGTIVKIKGVPFELKDSTLVATETELETLEALGIEIYEEKVYKTPETKRGVPNSFRTNKMGKLDLLDENGEVFASQG